MLITPKKTCLQVLLITLFIAALSCTNESLNKNYLIEGNLKKWQPVTLTFDGPQAAEKDSLNPFLDYSLWVNFQNGDEKNISTRLFCC